jgi:hypothetical protein
MKYMAKVRKNRTRKICRIPKTRRSSATLYIYIQIYPRKIHNINVEAKKIINAHFLSLNRLIIELTKSVIADRIIIKGRNTGKYLAIGMAIIRKR